jgi:uncharacterized protein YbcI
VTDGQLNAAMARHVVRTRHRFTGRGPTRAQSFYRANVVVVVMEETLTKAEESLIGLGKSDSVLAMRRQLSGTMKRDLIAEAEQLTGCRVVASLCADNIEPDYVVQMFILDRPVPTEPAPPSLHAVGCAAAAAQAASGGGPGDFLRVIIHSPSRSPRMPTTMSTVPAVWRLIPSTCSVTANLRIAPTAIRKRLVPMVMSIGIGRGQLGANVTRARAGAARVRRLQDLPW